MAAGISPLQLAVSKMLHSTIQKVQISSLAVGKCPMVRANNLLCTLAANSLVLLSLQRESIKSVKTI
jgi:hypothetical protein